MNKEEINSLKKSFKLESEKVRLEMIFSAYIRKETQEILQTRQVYFDRLASDEQDLYVANFKQALSGSLNTKLFELHFNDRAENSSQEIFQEMVEANSIDRFVQAANPFVEKLIENFDYEKDVVLNIVKFTYHTEEEVIPCIIGTVNKVEAAKKQLMFDYVEHEFDVHVDLNLVVNLKSPMDGFLYPVIEDGQINVNKVLNYHSKANKTNINFIMNLLTCKPILTAKEEKTYFNQILRGLIGDKIKPSVLHNLYEQLYNTVGFEENMEDRKIPKRLLQRLIENQGIEMLQRIDDVYEEVMGIREYEFCYDNVVPDFSKKSVVINNAEAEVKIYPSDLNKIQQVVDQNGERFLIIRLTEDTKTDVFDFATERQIPIALSTSE